MERKMSDLQVRPGISNNIEDQGNPNPNPQFRAELNGLLNRVRPQEAVKVEDNGHDGGAPPALMQKKVDIDFDARIEKLQLMIAQLEKRNKESEQLSDLRRKLRLLNETKSRAASAEKLRELNRKAEQELAEFRSFQQASENIQIDETMEDLNAKLNGHLNTIRHYEDALRDLHYIDEEFRAIHKEYFELGLAKAKKQKELCEAKYEAKRASAPARRYARR